jgi:hypothetical protein
VKGISCEKTLQRVVPRAGSTIWLDQRLTPEQNQTREYSLGDFISGDINKSGTAEAYRPSSLGLLETGFFIILKRMNIVDKKEYKEIER